MAYGLPMTATTTASRKAEANEHGVRWAASRSGRIQIAVGRKGTMSANLSGDRRYERWDVWALHTGTHDLAPVTRTFRTEAEANAYANLLWRTR